MKVMILHEHHGDRYLDVSTQEKLQKASLSVVKGRFGVKNDYYPFEEPTDPGPSPFNEEDIEKQHELFAPVIRTEILRHKAAVEAYKALKRQYESIKYCLEKNDGILAYRILQQRKYYDDEGFDIVEVKEVY